jgi:hypothetical protein
MNVTGARKFHVSSRSLALTIPLVTLLAASVFWNLHQHRKIEQKHLAVQREEAARAREENERVAARLKKNAEWAASDARVQQLYREIESFSQINERLLSETQRSEPRKIDSPTEADDLP